MNLNGNNGLATIVLTSFTTAVLMTVAQSWATLPARNVFEYGTEISSDAVNENFENLWKEVNLLTEYIEVDDVEHKVTIRGANLHIESGSSETYPATPTGLGNLIIGYSKTNADDPPYDAGDDEDYRYGDHNLVVGDFHRWEGSGNVLFGRDNAVRRDDDIPSLMTDASSLLGGEVNEVVGGSDVSVVVGGRLHTVDGGGHNVVVGGSNSLVSGSSKTAIVGGQLHRVTRGDTNGIFGGRGNVISVAAGNVTNSVIVGSELAIETCNGGDLDKFVMVGIGDTCSNVNGGGNNEVHGEMLPVCFQENDPQCP